MERTEGAAFGPLDRIGQLTMRNLDIADSRAKLELFARSGLLGDSTGSILGRLEAGGAERIADIGAPEAQGGDPVIAWRPRKGWTDLRIFVLQRPRDAAPARNCASCS